MVAVTGKKRTIKQRKKEVLEHLKQTHGIIATACAQAKISRRSFYEWLDQDEQFKDDVEDIIEITTDKVERKLLEQVHNGNLTAIIFYLKCKAKNRGWVEKQQIEQIGPRPIVVAPQWKTLFDNLENVQPDSGTTESV